MDEQASGPYRIWIHEHRFIEELGGTLCEDNVSYVPRGGAIINSLFVEKDVQKIFAYRSEQLRTIFGQTQSRSPLGRVTNPTASSTL